MKTFKEFMSESVIKDAAGYYLNTNTGVRSSHPENDYSDGHSPESSYKFHKKNYDDLKSKNGYKSHIEYHRVRMNKHGKKLGIPPVLNESVDKVKAFIDCAIKDHAHQSDIYGESKVNADV